MKARPTRNTDRASIAGVLVAIAAVVGGNALEGGHLGAILQPTAALIVLGGTLGAVVLQFPASALSRVASELRTVFQPATTNVNETMETLLRLAGKSRREGLVAIENEVESIDDSFLRRALELAVDGTDGKALRAALEGDIGRFEEEAEQGVKVLESAGGYAPTVGILGAVLGLVHVMQNLSDPSKLGAGIATAFVATIYGVASANLLLLPMAGKLKARHRERVLAMELAIEGVVGVAEGQSPRVIERRLHAYVEGEPSNVTPIRAVAWPSSRPKGESVPREAA